MGSGFGLTIELCSKLKIKMFSDFFSFLIRNTYFFVIFCCFAEIVYKYKRWSTVAGLLIFARNCCNSGLLRTTSTICTFRKYSLEKVFPMKEQKEQKTKQKKNKNEATVFSSNSTIANHFEF